MLGAVWFGGGMGLLDEAIREHLELKRRSGADPSEVAREVHEVLAPVSPDGDAAADDELQELAQEAAVGQEHVTEAHAVPEAGHPPPDSVAGDPSPVGEETAELDMHALMGEEPSAGGAGPPLDASAIRPTQAPGGEGASGREDLEWDVSPRLVDGSDEDGGPGRGNAAFE